MNDIIIIQSIAGLFLIGFLLLVLMGIRIYRLNNNYQDALQKCDTSQSHIAAMCSAAVNIGKTIDQMDRKIEALSDRQEKYELTEPQGKTRTYSQARILLNNGANLDDVAESCGMPYGEAELIAMMVELEAQQLPH